MSFNLSQAMAMDINRAFQRDDEPWGMREREVWARRQMEEDYMQRMTMANRNGMVFMDGSFGAGTEVDPRGVVTEEDKEAVASAFTDIKTAVEPVAIVDKKVVSEHATKLKTLGFTKLHSAVAEVADRAMKLNLVGMAGYQKIPKEKLEAAKKKIEGRSNSTRKLRLLETSIEEYVGQNGDADNLTLPPTEVLSALETAKKSELFDSFSILHVVQIPDPILLGRIKGIEDSFFIAEWGNDISLKEILG